MAHINIYSLLDLCLHMHVRRSVQPGRESSGSHRLSGDEKWERSQCWNINPADLRDPAEQRPVPADRGPESGTLRWVTETAWWGGAGGALHKRAGCVPLGPIQLSDTIANTELKHMYKDTHAYTQGEKKSNWGLEEQSCDTGKGERELTGVCLTWPHCLLKWWKPPGWRLVKIYTCAHALLCVEQIPGPTSSSVHTEREYAVWRGTLKG